MYLPHRSRVYTSGIQAEEWRSSYASGVQIQTEIW